MGDEKKERRLADGEFWDAAALNATRGLADTRWKDGGHHAPLAVASRAAEIADHLLAERRKRREGGAQ